MQPFLQTFIPCNKMYAFEHLNFFPSIFPSLVNSLHTFRYVLGGELFVCFCLYIYITCNHNSIFSVKHNYFELLYINFQIHALLESYKPSNICCKSFRISANTHSIICIENDMDIHASNNTSLDITTNILYVFIHKYVNHGDIRYLWLSVCSMLSYLLNSPFILIDALIPTFSALITFGHQSSTFTQSSP